MEIKIKIYAHHKDMLDYSIWRIGRELEFTPSVPSQMALLDYIIENDDLPEDCSDFQTQMEMWWIDNGENIYEIIGE
jgi:hypothetical protein